MASCRVWSFGVLTMTLGCAVSTGNTQTFHDAGSDVGTRRDAGLALADAGDAALPDTGLDAAVVVTDTGPDGGSDGGHDAAVIATPVVDGTVGTAEWSAASSGSSATVTVWAGDELRTIRAIAIAGTLYLAIEGQIESNNGIVVYIDGDPSGSHGVADLATLTDSTGALDNAVSAGFTTPTSFRTDVAWGTTVMSHVVTGADDTTGFRDVTVINNFSWLTPAQTACTATACEASIATAMLGPGAAPRTIQLFARIVSPDGTTSPNQTLPMDAPGSPRVVANVLVLHE